MLRCMKFVENTTLYGTFSLKKTLDIMKLLVSVIVIMQETMKHDEVPLVLSST